MENNAGNDGLCKEFYKYFWDKIKKPFLASIHRAYLSQEISSAQNQAVIKMFGKMRQRQEIH